MIVHVFPETSWSQFTFDCHLFLAVTKLGLSSSSHIDETRLLATAGALDVIRFIDDRTPRTQTKPMRCDANQGFLHCPLVFMYFLGCLSELIQRLIYLMTVRSMDVYSFLFCTPPQTI